MTKTLFAPKQPKASPARGMRQIDLEFGVTNHRRPLSAYSMSAQSLSQRSARGRASAERMPSCLWGSKMSPKLRERRRSTRSASSTEGSELGSEESIEQAITEQSTEGRESCLVLAKLTVSFPRAVVLHLKTTRVDNLSKLTVPEARPFLVAASTRSSDAVVGSTFVAAVAVRSRDAEPPQHEDELARAIAAAEAAVNRLGRATRDAAAARIGTALLGHAARLRVKRMRRRVYAADLAASLIAGALTTRDVAATKVNSGARRLLATRLRRRLMWLKAMAMREAAATKLSCAARRRLARVRVQRLRREHHRSLALLHQQRQEAWQRRNGGATPTLLSTSFPDVWQRKQEEQRDKHEQTARLLNRPVVFRDGHSRSVVLLHSPMAIGYEQRHAVAHGRERVLRERGAGPVRRVVSSLTGGGASGGGLVGGRPPHTI